MGECQVDFINSKLLPSDWRSELMSLLATQPIRVEKFAQPRLSKTATGQLRVSVHPVQVTQCMPLQCMPLQCMPLQCQSLSALNVNLAQVPTSRSVVNNSH
eukprot:2339950-Amphidinium_carterae.2